MRKIMKITVSIMMAIIMLFMAVPFVFADGETNFSVILAANKPSVKRGETVEVTIELGEFSNIENGINSFMGDLEYDETKLSIESGQIVAQNGWDAPVYENDKLLTTKGSMVTSNEEIIKITFTVKAEAELGITKITVKNAEAANSENDFLGIEGTVNIEIVNDSTGLEGCEHTTTVFRHSETEHWKVCSECGQEVESRAAHNYTYLDNQNGRHTATCTGCDYSTTSAHEFRNGECENCGAVESSGGEECEHTYDTVHNDLTEHWNVCSKCNKEEAGSREAHNYSYVDNKNGTHTATCIVCSYKMTEEHNFNNGVCDECDSVESTDDDCDHTFKQGYNQTQHWEACTKCGQIKRGTLKTHTYDVFRDNGDGTHDARCSTCGHELLEAHDPNKACDDCGYKPAANNNGGSSNGGNNNGTNKDNTVADKEIPKAGLNIMIVFGIVAIVAVAIIMYNKNEKYKDIR